MLKFTQPVSVRVALGTQSGSMSPALDRRILHYDIDLASVIAALNFLICVLRGLSCILISV